MSNDGPTEPRKSTDLTTRVLVVIVGAIASGSGLVTVTSTDDRIRRTEVEQTIQVIDVKIESIQKDMAALRRDVDRIDESGPAVGNRDFARRITNLEQELKDLVHR